MASNGNKVTKDELPHYQCIKCQKPYVVDLKFSNSVIFYFDACNLVSNTVKPSVAKCVGLLRRGCKKNTAVKRVQTCNPFALK